MDIAKILKMTNDELQNEISARRKKIKTLQNEIKLFERLAKEEGEHYVPQEQTESASAGSFSFTE